MLRADILKTARQLVSLRTPYVHGGRTAEGVDCVGVITWVCEQLNYPFKDYPEGYSQRPDGKLLEVLKEQGILKPTTSFIPTLIAPGDIGVFWLLPRSRLPQHVGFFTETGGLIHACRKVRRVVETSTLDPFWIPRFVACVCFKGLEDT